MVPAAPFNVMMFGAWTEFIAAYLLFLISHALPARPRLRQPLIALLGKPLYFSLYGLVSILCLAWLIAAAGHVPYVGLWEFAPWQIWVPHLAMPWVCLAFAFGVAACNPFSIAPYREAAFDAEHPGIAGVTRHPLLWGLALWAGSHVLPNGDLAHLAMFAGLALFALIGMAAIDRRRRRQFGDDWRPMTAKTSFLPFTALIQGRWRPHFRQFSMLRLAAAILLYLSLLWLHPFLIGVAIMPIGQGG